MELIKDYEYMDDILVAMITGDWSKIPVEYNWSGSRLSGKTTCFSIALAKIIAVAQEYDIKVAFYCARKMTKSVPELVSEIKVALDDLGLNYSFTGSSKKSSYPVFAFANGSFVQVLGITNSNSENNLKGLAKCYDFELSIDWVEEANECFQKDYQDLRFSIRGAKREIHWTSCNPDREDQDHIKYLNTNVPFDINYMKAYGQMLTIWKKKIGGGKSLLCLNHYTNWKVNPYLSDAKKNALEELLISDPIKAIPWYYGMPGSLQGTIFGEYLPRARKELDFRITNYYAGLDLGYSEAATAHPTTLQIVGANDEQTRYHCVAEYYHDNISGGHKSLNQIYQDIINCAVDNIVKKEMRQGQLIIRTDYGSGGLVAIDMLNRIVAAMIEECHDPIRYGALRKIVFAPVEKDVWFTKDRIDAWHLLMSQGKLGLNKDLTPNLLRQMAAMKYKDNKSAQTYKVEMLDYMDDCWDAACYAIMPVLKNTINNVNPLLRKGSF
jgi:PBSX family phage terminase large subunit